MSRDVLYIAQDHTDRSIYDRGSRACVGIVEISAIDVLVQNVNVLQEKKVALPDWLTGTPSFVDVAAKQVFRGSHAIRRLREKVASAEEEASGAARRQQETPAKEDGGVQGMTAPGQRFLASDSETGDHLTDIPSAQAGGGEVREGSVTESELQAYMQRREAAIPNSAGQQPL